MSLGLIIQLWITMLTWLLEFILVTLTLRCWIQIHSLVVWFL